MSQASVGPAPAPAVGINETLELLDGVELVLLAGKKALADGQINWQDLGVALELLNKAAVLTQAFRGLDQLPKEAADISADEVNRIAARVIALVNALKA